MKSKHSSTLRRVASEHGVWFGSSLLGWEEQPTPGCLAFPASPALAQSGELGQLRALLDAILADTARLGVRLPKVFLLQEAQVFYAGASPVEVRLRGWEDWRPTSFEEGFVRAQGKPWKVGGACQLLRSREQLRLGPMARGLHHRSLSVVRDVQGVSLVGSWMLQGPERAPQLLLGFEAPAASAGQAAVELCRLPQAQLAQGPERRASGDM